MSTPESPQPESTSEVAGLAGPSGGLGTPGRGLPRSPVALASRYAGNHAAAALVQRRRASSAASAPGGLLQRDPPPVDPAVQSQIDDLKKTQAILTKKQAASDQDSAARGRFNRRLSSYREASARIAAAFDTATTNFSTAQIAQAQSDALAAQLLGAAVAIGFAAGFEWFFVPALGGLGMEANTIKKTIEAIENPANALVSGSVNVAGVLVATGSAEKGAAPAGPTQGGALAYLARNLGEIAKHESALEDAFSARRTKLGEGSDEAWEKFDPKAQQTIYDNLYAALEKSAASVEKLPAEAAISRVVERQMWALWIKANTGYVFMKREGGDKVKPMPKQGEAKAEDVDEITLAVGADREQRLNALGIDKLANVKLTGHWYSMNEPSNWRDYLWAWATNYNERIEDAK